MGDITCSDGFSYRNIRAPGRPNKTIKVDEKFIRLVNADYEEFTERIELDCTPFAKKHLCIQSIEGHARNGHCMFGGEIYPEATTEDVLEALFIDVDRFKEERQKEIEKVFDWTYDVIRGADYKRFALGSENLFGIGLFDDIEINNVNDVLFGMYIGSIMDNYEWRQKVNRKFGHQMGGGECVALNIPKLKKLRWGIDALSTMETPHWLIEEFQETGAMPAGNVVTGTRDVISGFVRYKHGPGVSDDAAMIIAGVLYNLDTAMGVFLADAIDTWDKCTKNIIRGGNDEYIGKIIRGYMENFVDFREIEDDLVEFIYLSAVSPHSPKGDPDCSQRYFLQTDRKTNRSAIDSHITFIRHMLKYVGKNPQDRKDRNPKQIIGFNRIKNRNYYHKVIKQRMYAYFKGQLPDYSAAFPSQPSHS